MDFILEHLSEILLGLEIFLLKIFGKNETAEEKKKRLVDKQSKKVAKEIAKVQKDSAKLEEITKKEVL